MKERVPIIELLYFSLRQYGMIYSINHFSFNNLQNCEILEPLLPLNTKSNC